MRSRSKHTFVGLALAAFALLAPACQTATPATRIKENPAMYQSLTPEQQQLVSQGRIENGMSQQAVFLAWGAPNSQPYVGQQGKKNLERWVYTRMEPVMVMSNWDVPCPGRYGWCADYGPDTAYIPRRTATVTFENGKVVAWETLSR